MSGGNLSPRQKMINMMYLVLTALLALNVSAEILKAFHMVEVSMDRAGSNIDKKNESTWKAIDKYHSEFGADANGTDIWNRAKKVRQISAEGVKYFADLKKVLIDGAGGRKDGDPEEEVAEPSNIEKHANLLIVQGKGAEVKKKIEDVKEQLMSMVPKDKKSTIKSDLSTEVSKGHAGQTWESEMFEHTPVAAVVAILSKTQNDIKNTEAQVLDELRKSISEADFTFDKLEPKIIPNNGTFITLGSEYSADIFVAASSSKAEASIQVNGKDIPVEGGVGKYKVNPTSEGEIKYSGVISAKKPNGQIEKYPFEQSFTALKPLAVISAVKMNVVYIGLDNPISVSVPGFSPNDVVTSCSAGGTLRPDKQKGTYLLKVDGTQREITISASVKDKEGKVKKMGEGQKYRVRPVPDPQPQLGALKSGDFAPGVIRTSQFVLAVLENFAYEGIKYTPVAFQFGYFPKKGNFQGLAANGQALTPQMRSILNGIQSGDKIIIANMKVDGPGGVRPLSTPLLINVK